MFDRTSIKDEDKAAVLKNDLAYHDLVMACVLDHAFGYVQVAETANSHGDTCKASKDLCKRYNDVMENDLIALTMEYNNCKIKKAHDNPCLWYTELKHLQLPWSAWGTEETDAEVVASIMRQIPSQVQGVDVSTES